MSVVQDYAEIVADVKAEIEEQTAAGWMTKPQDTFVAIEMALEKMYQRGRQDERFAREEYDATCDRWEGQRSLPAGYPFPPSCPTCPRQVESAEAESGRHLAGHPPEQAD